MHVIVFAGTSEGRELAARLAALPVSVTVCVATEYGHELLTDLPGSCTVAVGRRDARGMCELLAETGCRVVVDATHPYAKEASANIRRAAGGLSVERLRLLRRASPPAEADYVDSPEAAAAALRATDGNILLTTGSKHLEAFTAIPDFSRRVFPRVLPVEESLAECRRLGYAPANIVAMQGPFGVELNLALMRHFAIRHLVTKDGGAAGGFPEKMRAAREAGVRALVIGRPAEEDGLDIEAVMTRIARLVEGGA